MIKNVSIVPATGKTFVTIPRPTLTDKKREYKKRPKKRLEESVFEKYRQKYRQLKAQWIKIVS